MAIMAIKEPAVDKQDRWGTALRVGVCMLAFVAVGCGGGRAAQRVVEDNRQEQEFQGRKAGETRLAAPNEVTAELGCGTNRARLARLEKAEVLPVRPTAGREINHRFIYSACDMGPQPVTGTLTRKLILRRTSAVVVEEKIRTTLRPGRWAVDVMIGIPPNAEPGWYGVEVTFEHPRVPLYNWQYFQLLARQ